MKPTDGKASSHSPALQGPNCHGQPLTGLGSIRGTPTVGLRPRLLTFRRFAASPPSPRPLCRRGDREEGCPALRDGVRALAWTPRTLAAPYSARLRLHGGEIRLQLSDYQAVVTS